MARGHFSSTFIFDDVDAFPSGMGLPRPAWVRLNRLRTGVGLFRSSMHRWGMAATASWECGAEEQTADYIITSCPSYRHANGIRGLLTVNESWARWLSDTCSAIYSDAISRCNIAPTRRISVSLTPRPEQIIFLKFLADCNLPPPPLNIPLATPLLLHYRAKLTKFNFQKVCLK